MTAISVKDLWLFRGDHPVLEDINLDVVEGDFMGLIGPNGGGKTTFLKVLLGMIKPDKGSVEIMGLDPIAARKFIGYVPQKNIFDQNFPVTALDVVLMGRYSRAGLFKRYGQKDKEEARKSLRAVGMEEDADIEIGSLSGGEQQRIFVARSLVSNPKLLLLDEPATGIDAAQQTEFYDLLSRLNKSRGITIVMVSHDLTAVSRYVSKLACLNQRLYYHGTDELTEEDVEKAYGCPVDMIAHGTPHRVLKEHDY